MPTPVDPGKAFYRFMNALAEDTSLASDEELLQEAKAEGDNFERKADSVRRLLLDSIYQVKKSRLRAAVDSYQQSVHLLTKVPSLLPVTPMARRQKLAWILQRRPEMREAALTLQNRNFEAMTDADVERLLGQLQHLGVVEPLEDEEPP